MNKTLASTLGAFALFYASIALWGCGLPEGTLTGSTPPPAASSEPGAEHVPSADVQVRTEQENRGCPVLNRTLRGKGRTGMPCSAAEQCAPVCCRCEAPGNSMHSYLAVACIDGACVGLEETCAASRSEELCPSVE